MSTQSQLELYSEYTQADVKDSESVPTLVFLHGWGMHGDIWAQVIETNAGACNTLVIDMPGMGRSPIPEGEYDLDYVIRHIGKAIQPYARQELHLVGWSLGAIIAAALAVKFKSQLNIKSLFLVSMGATFVANGQQPGMSQDDFTFFKTLLHEDFEGTLYRFLGLNTKGSDQQRAEIRLLQQLVFSYGFPARKALAGGLDILQQIRLDSLLSEAAITTRVVLGENDALVPVGVREVLITNKYVQEVHIIRGAGHIAFLGHLDEFNVLLKKYLIV